MECNLGNAVAYSPQPWDWLENRGGKDDEVSGGMWKAVEAKARKIRMAKTKRRREKEGKREEARRKEREEKGKAKAKERKKGGSAKSGGRMRDLGWGRRNSKVRSRSKEAGTRKIP